MVFVAAITKGKSYKTDPISYFLKENDEVTQGFKLKKDQY